MNNIKDPTGICQYELLTLDIISHKGDRIDITKLFTTLVINEDLLADGLSGQVMISDATSLADNLPIIGQEKLVVQWKTKGEDVEPIELTFDVTNIGKRLKGNDRTESYILRFVSPELNLSARTRISRAFKGTASDIVSEIFTKDLKSKKRLIVEPAKHFQRFVSPYMKPLEIINNITRTAVSASPSGSSKKAGVTYVWFETTRGFNFQSLEHLFTLDSVKTFTMNPQHTRDDVGAMDFDAAARNIHGIKVTKSFDTLTNMRNGMYANTLVMHDPINKTIEELDYNYIRDFPSHAHLEGNVKTSIISSGASSVKKTTGFLCSPYTDENGLAISDYTSNTIIVHPRASSLWDDVKSDHAEEWKRQRKPHLAQLDSFEVEISVMGDSELQAGDVVELLIPVNDHVEGEANLYSAMVSGRYIISAIEHVMTREHYGMTLVLNKESLGQPIT